MVSFPPVSPPRPYTPPSPHPYSPHAQPISFFSILSPAQYWVRSTNAVRVTGTVNTYRCTPCFGSLFNRSPGRLRGLYTRGEAHNFCTVYRMAQKLLDSRYVTTETPCLSNFVGRYSDLLRAGRSGDRIPAGERFSSPVQTSRGAHPSSHTVGTGSFLGVKRPRLGVDHPPYLALSLKKE